MMSPTCSRLVVKAMISIAAPAVGLAQCSSRLTCGQVELDRLVQPVDDVVALADLVASLRSSVRSTVSVSRSINSSASPMRRVSRAAAAMRERRACRAPSGRDSAAWTGRRRSSGRAASARPARAAGPSSGRNTSASARLKAVWKLATCAPGSAVERGELRCDDHRRSGSASGDADRAEGEIAERHAPRRDVAAPGRQHRRQGAAEIGAEHQRQRQRTGISPTPASDMIRRMIATLECASQVRPAADAPRR